MGILWFFSCCSRKLGVALKLQQGPQEASQVASGTSDLLSCVVHLRNPLESLQENSALLSSCNRDLGIHIEVQQGSQSSSPLEAWNSTFLSSCKRGVKPPVELRREIRLFLEVQQGSQNSLHVVRGNSGFHLRHCRGIRSYL